jgi:UDP-glucose 4-epimerase
MGFQSALITGGAGFIGSHLTEHLLSEGCRVTVIDDLSTGRWQNVAHLDGNPLLRIIIASAEDRDLIEREIPHHDIVYHLASAVGVRLIIDQPVKTVETIVNTTGLILRVCSRYRRPVLVTSSSEVYGKSNDIPFREDADVILGPTEKRRWAYACAKAVDEFLCLAHYYETSLPVYIARLFNTVGPRQTGQYGMVLPTFISQALAGRPLTVFGDGKQKRCFCSVHDAVRGLARLPLVREAAGKVVNLGSQEEISIEDLAKKVILLCQSCSTIEHVSYDGAYGPGFDDMMRRVPDLTRARKLIDWEPKHSLDYVILEIAEQHRSGGHGGSP